ncbi:1,2-phenylacetyl-CoA epoxidase subunit PaaD [Bacillus kwashiorkori]|uniref:1,2-phenylacetyl-CoA epoxidase subunit PaaD n=1 Tax=Bacillus kwashiorkori TaxID=1522318 RepID=UPI0007846F1B|nr:1,2-phenylacetyl-CoA epoxidase subunit PaaD [Bacillus kwashiorkori]
MLTENQLIIDKIHEILQHVKDPEIPSVSVMELGMIENIKVDNGNVIVEALPTFVGCPALDIIKANIENAIKDHLEHINSVICKFIYHPPWTSDRISTEGREKLKQFGIAPPPEFFTETGLWSVHCPYCDSAYTTIENIFGPTACRSILYCKNCKNPFEAMKPISTL